MVMSPGVAHIMSGLDISNNTMKAYLIDDIGNIKKDMTIESNRNELDLKREGLNVSKETYNVLQSIETESFNAGNDTINTFENLFVVRENQMAVHMLNEVNKSLNSRNRRRRVQIGLLCFGVDTKMYKCKIK